MLKRYNFKVLSWGLVIILSVVGVITSDQRLSAEGSPYVWDTLRVEANDTIPADVFDGRCLTKEIQAQDYLEPNFDRVSTYKACVFEGLNISFAFYPDKEYRIRWAAKVDSDPLYRIINNANALDLRVVKGTNKIVFLSPGGQFINTTLSTIDDARDALNVISRSPLGQVTLYELDISKAKKWMGYELYGEKRYLPVYNFAMSPNGEFALAWVNRTGHVKIDFKKDSVTALGRFMGNWYGGSHSNPYAGAITNDGKYAFTTGGPTVISTENCGYALTSKIIQDEQAFEPYMPSCPTKDLYSTVSPIAGFAGYADYFFWREDENRLEFLYQTPPQAGVVSKKTMIHLYIGMAGSGLKYLALGDSYSSGEGDIGKQQNGLSYYTEATAMANGCHLSVRSYPFILKQYMDIAESHMQSVACSGARVTPDYTAKSEEYFGQHDELKLVSPEQLILKRKNALESFTPGLIPQLEFIKANKPRVVTLTGGGNDVGFGKVLVACAAPAWGDGTCDYAKKNHELRNTLGESIDAQYDHTVNLIKSIKALSPATTIYVIGYPSFIADKWAPCVNKIALNANERELITEGVSYMNDVLEAASKDQGAHYINLQASLDGGRICEGSEYVTGLTDYIKRDAQTYNELFHPNAEGHRLMADDIQGAGFTISRDNNPESVSTDRPAMPEYFTAKNQEKTQQYDMTVGKVRVNSSLRVVTGAVWASQSKVKLILHSKPVQLGDIMTNRDGSLAADVMIPGSVKPGLHMLIAKGHDVSGKAKRLYQFIEVTAPGVPSMDEEPCFYFAGWRDERSGEVLCRE